MQHTAPHACEPVEPDPAGETKRPPRPDLEPDLGALGGAQSPGLAIRWTSTRNDREPMIGNPAGVRWLLARARAIRLAVRRLLNSAIVAAPATKPVAAAAAAWTAGRAAGEAGSIART